MSRFQNQSSKPIKKISIFINFDINLQNTGKYLCAYEEIQ